MEPDKSRRGIYLGLAGLAVVALLVVLLRPSGIAVDTATVARGTLSVTVEEQGRTRARERYTVAAPITGRLLRTKFEAGDGVKAGDVLAHIARHRDSAQRSCVCSGARARGCGGSARGGECRQVGERRGGTPRGFVCEGPGKRGESRQLFTERGG
jgi:hypothetical protein